MKIIENKIERKKTEGAGKSGRTKEKKKPRITEENK
jgi:hypothetical protein